MKLPVDIKPLYLDRRKTSDAIRNIAVVEFGKGGQRSFDLGDQKYRAPVGELRREYSRSEILRHVSFHVLRRVHQRESVIESTPCKPGQHFGVGGRGDAD